METKLVRIDASAIRDEDLAEAVGLLKAGEVVVIPTETVYGLGANALSAEACTKIFEAKNRPIDNPLIVHVDSMEMLRTLVDEDKAASIPGLDAVVKAFWPGPLTILLPRSARVPELVTAGHPTVAVRMPSHPVARRIIELAQIPIAAPSANLSGRPSPTTAAHAFADLNGRVKCVVDSGPCSVGVESTVVDLARTPPVILRPGGVTLEQLRTVIPTMEVFRGTMDKPATPGLKYKHYAPDARAVLLEGSAVAMGPELLRRIALELGGGRRVGVIHTHGEIALPADANLEVIAIGADGRADAVAQGIFAALRTLDERRVDIIFIEGISEEHEGLAVMNRVRKAASETIVCG